tara:strand:- start:111 stop:380 length:270 start_codon:yes stop_codon:yes gene_type:complete
MRDSNSYSIDQIKSWAWKNNIYIISDIIDKSQSNPPDLRIIVKYWGFTTRGEVVYSQKKKQHYELSKKINKMYRYYYETYIENKEEIKI